MHRWEAPDGEAQPLLAAAMVTDHHQVRRTEGVVADHLVFGDGKSQEGAALRSGQQVLSRHVRLLADIGRACPD